MADSKTNKSTKKTTAAGKTAAKSVEKTPTKKAKAVASAASKAVSANTAAESKAASAKAAPAEAAKPKAKQDAKPAPAPNKKVKEKSSGKGMAFFALLCALGALGLSGFNFYEQHMSPNKVQTQDALLSGVNDIKTNVAEFGTVVSGLQQDVEAFKSSQEQYVTVETLNEAVKDGVDQAVTNLPDLPKIGPASNNVNDTINVESDVNNDGSESEVSVDAQSSTAVEKGVEPLNSQTVSEVSNNVSTLDIVETNEVVAASEEDQGSAWTLSRAKQDFKDMLMGFISIKKTDQSDK